MQWLNLQVQVKFGTKIGADALPENLRKAEAQAYWQRHSMLGRLKQKRWEGGVKLEQKSVQAPWLSKQLLKNEQLV